jgi:hypothetical protein
MTALTAAAYKALILAEVQDPDGVLAAQLDTCWDLYPDLPVGRTRYLRTLIKGIDVLLGSVRAQADFAIQGDLSVKLGQLTDHLAAKRAAAESDLAAELRGLTGRAPAMGTLTAVVPVASPAGAPDANAPVYRGSPNPPWPWRGRGAW